MWKSLALPLRRSSRAKRIGELIDREDAFRIVTHHLFQGHAFQESKVISLHGLGSAALPELTYLAMLVQDEYRLTSASALESQT